MNRYRIYQQQPPRGNGMDFRLNLHACGELEAYSGSHAIDLAKQLPAFQRAQGLARFPIVHQLTRSGNEMPAWIQAQNMRGEQT